MSDGHGVAGKAKQWILVVVALAAVGWAVMHLTAGEEEIPVPASRSVRDFVVDWECLDCRHRFRQNSGPGAQPCPRCSKASCYVVLTWTCRQHGAVRIAFDYDEAGQPSKASIAGGPWQAAMNEYGGWDLNCPKCDAPLSPPR